MKPLSSARTQETVLPDGRVRLHIEHEVLRGVTPQMLVWWWRNLSGEMELNGRSYARYLIWHPIDHIHFELAKRLPDGSVGPGAVFHIVEALGADMQNLIDARLHLRELDEKGAIVEVRPAGLTVAQIRGQFLPKEAGTQVISSMTLGVAGWWTELNRWMLDRFFPRSRRNAWLKHSVEEVPSLSHDVDTPDDLGALADVLGGRRAVAPMTRGALRQLDRAQGSRFSAAEPEAVEV